MDIKYNLEEVHDILEKDYGRDLIGRIEGNSFKIYIVEQALKKLSLDKYDFGNFLNDTWFLKYGFVIKEGKGSRKDSSFGKPDGFDENDIEYIRTMIDIQLRSAEKGIELYLEDLEESLLYIRFKFDDIDEILFNFIKALSNQDLIDSVSWYEQNISAINNEFIIIHDDFKKTKNLDDLIDSLYNFLNLYSSQDLFNEYYYKLDENDKPSNFEDQFYLDEKGEVMKIYDQVNDIFHDNIIDKIKTLIKSSYENYY